MRSVLLFVCLLAVAVVAYATMTAPESYDATSTPQLLILNGSAANNEARILQGIQFSSVYIYADDTEAAVFSAWRVTASGVDTTWARPSMFSAGGDTIGTIPAGTAIRFDLDGVDALYFSAGSGVVVKQ